MPPSPNKVTDPPRRYYRATTFGPGIVEVWRGGRRREILVAPGEVFWTEDPGQDFNQYPNFERASDPRPQPERINTITIPRAEYDRLVAAEQARLNGGRTITLQLEPVPQLAPQGEKLQEKGEPQPQPKPLDAEAGRPDVDGGLGPAHTEGSSPSPHPDASNNPDVSTDLGEGATSPALGEVGASEEGGIVGEAAAAKDLKGVEGKSTPPLTPDAFNAQADKDYDWARRQVSQLGLSPDGRSRSAIKAAYLDWYSAQ